MSEAKEQLMRYTHEARVLIALVGKQVDTAGKFYEAGQPIWEDHESHLAFKVHPWVKQLVVEAINELVAALRAGWEDPSEFEVARIGVAVLAVEGCRRMLLSFDDLSSVVGFDEAQRLIEGWLDANA